MARRVAAVLAGTLAAVVLASTALAADLSGAYEVSPFVGGYWFDGDAKLDAAPVFGARVGRWLTREWEPEFSFEGLRTDGEHSGDGANFFQTHLDALYHFGVTKRFLPFLAAGIGAARYQGGDHGETEWDFLANYGAGLKYFVGDRWALRLDLRQPITIGPPRYNVMATLGLSYVWGGRRGEVTAGEARPEMPRPPMAGEVPPQPRGPGAEGAGQKPPEAARAAPPASRPGAAPPPGPSARPEAARPEVARPFLPAAPPGGPEARGPAGPSMEGPPPGTGAAEEAPARPVEGAGLPGRPLPGFQTIHFDFDEYALTPESIRLLGASAAEMKSDAGLRVTIEGHCDERGTTEYNMALGENRAKAAFDYLVDQGISPSRMSTVSYGREQPVDPGHNEEAWARNRRAEFVRGR